MRDKKRTRRNKHSSSNSNSNCTNKSSHGHMKGKGKGQEQGQETGQGKGNRVNNMKHDHRNGQERGIGKSNSNESVHGVACHQHTAGGDDDTEDDMVDNDVVDTNAGGTAIRSNVDYYKVLHTGDMRWNEAMKTHPLLSSFHHSLDALYLDTTYCHHRHKFPLQSETIQAVLDCIATHIHDPGVVFVFATYVIGRFCVYARVYAWLHTRVRMLG